MHTACRNMLFVLALAATASWGQQAEEDSATAGERAATGEVQSSAGAEQTTISGEQPVEQQPTTVDDAGADDQLPEPEVETAVSPPSDYRPSEEISDDLSVSFPVDI